VSLQALTSGVIAGLGDALCSKDFWYQEASVKKIASFQCKAGGLFFSLVFFPYSHLGFLLGNERREFWWHA